MTAISARIVGIQFAPGSQDHLSTLTHGAKLTLKRNPDNPYDSNAIEVHSLSGLMLGHIPAGLAKVLAPIMDEGTELFARIESIPPHLLLFTKEDPEFLETYEEEEA